MRVLYLTNYHNPYRDEFFEQLGLKCDLTVFFEQSAASTRDASWFEHPQATQYKEILSSPNTSRTALMKALVRQTWDVIVFGCYNSPTQIKTMLHLRRRQTPFILNSDGMVFASSNPLKERFKRYVLRSATAYLIAGEKCVESLRDIVGDSAIIQSYPFTSLTQKQVKDAAEYASEARLRRKNNLILTVGQFESYKGLDVLLSVAHSYPEIRFRIVGVGNKQAAIDRLIQEQQLQNVEVISFLNPSDLAQEYASARLFVLPSRQECWGLVINEAAAYGCPIVSTWESGAAVEYLSDLQPDLLAKPGDASSLAHAIDHALSMSYEELENYSAYLVQKSKRYTIENCVAAHLNLFTHLLQDGQL